MRNPYDTTDLSKLAAETQEAARRVYDVTMPMFSALPGTVAGFAGVAFGTALVADGALYGPSGHLMSVGGMVMAVVGGAALLVFGGRWLAAVRRVRAYNRNLKLRRQALERRSG